MEIIRDKFKLIVTVLIVILFLWFLVINPFLIFHKNESLLRAAAFDYFDRNSNELPTGERVKTVSLETLYHKAYLKKDLYAPYTRRSCSIKNSWVKVKHVGDDYKYYVYLDCGGALHSLVDHKGPEIHLNGSENISIGLGEGFKDPGIKNVIDSKDGRIDVKEVTIRGEVDSSRVGTYELTYTAYDKLRNKTVVTRTVQVVQKLYQTVKSKLGDARNFIGNPTGNYLQISNMLFRIYGIDDTNVYIVADEDVANVNYTKLTAWLDYYYEHLSTDAKKMIVDYQFCNMTVSESSLDTTQCNSYTSKRKVFIPSIIEVNKASSLEDNFMKPNTISWVANPKSNNEAYVTRSIFFDDAYGKNFISYDTSDNYGVRPMMVIKGSSLITGGTGTRSDPYVFGDVNRAKAGDSVHSRYTGEYIIDGNIMWRIIEPIEDGTTKVISVAPITSLDSDLTFVLEPEHEKIVYDPKDKTSLGYFINNRLNKYVDTSIFENHIINVPIYKNKIVYKEEVENKKYKATLSAPDMYEMFSAQTRNLLGINSRSYWLINSSKAKSVAGIITDIGVPLNEKIPEYYTAGVRVVGYLKKDIIISGGKGTENSPYVIK